MPSLQVIFIGFVITINRSGASNNNISQTDDDNNNNNNNIDNPKGKVQRAARYFLVRLVS